MYEMQNILAKARMTSFGVFVSIHNMRNGNTKLLLVVSTLSQLWVSFGKSGILKLKDT